MKKNFFVPREIRLTITFYTLDKYTFPPTLGNPRKSEYGETNQYIIGIKQ